MTGGGERRDETERQVTGATSDGDANAENKVGAGNMADSASLPPR